MNPHAAIPNTRHRSPALPVFAALAMMGGLASFAQSGDAGFA